MINRIRCLGAAASIALLVAGLSGCDGGRTRPPPVSLRVVHAAPTAPPIDFYREQRAVQAAQQIDYRGVSSRLVFDEDEYDFSARTFEPGTGQSIVLSSFAQAISADNEYVFVLTEIGGVMTPIVVGNPVFESESETAVSAVHAAPGLAAMDAFVEPPGTDLTTATPLGSLGFGADLDTATRDPGDYRLTLTTPGDPAGVLFSSGTMTLAAGDAHSFVIVDDAGDGVAPFTVVRVGPSSALLFGSNVRSGVQLINAAADQAARDVFVDGDYTTPLVAAIPYGSAADLALLTPGTRNLSITPAGNPGVVEDEQDLAAGRGERYTALIAGEPGDVSVEVSPDDNRRVTGHARLRFMNGASQHTPLEFFLVAQGTDIANVSPRVALAAPGIGRRASEAPGDYEIVLRDADTRTVVYGPELIALDAGIYTVLAVNGAAAGTADVVLLEDFN